MKVVFLDIDGVLNNSNWAIQMYDEGVHVYAENLLDERAIRLLQKLIDATDAKIVVSSSWRRDDYAMQCLSDQLKPMEIYDVTPLKSSIRGDEISAWLKKHKDVERYVILDDDSDMGDEITHLIQTTFERGLQPEHIEEAIKWLNS